MENKGVLEIMVDFKWKQVSGTDGGGCFQEKVKIPYLHLLEAFGKGESSCDKSNTEWFFEFKLQGCREVFSASLYDYRDDRPLQEIDEWHIGGSQMSGKLLVMVLQNIFTDINIFP